MGITLKWNAVADLSADEAFKLLCSAAMTFGNTTIADYAFAPGEDCTGLYFFFDEGKLAYVGKCSSRAFIERVPSHLDARPRSYFGTLLKKMAGKGHGPDEGHLRSALRFTVALIAISRKEKFKFRNLETELRRLWQPRLNKDKLRDTTGSMTLRELAYLK